MAATVINENIPFDNKFDIIKGILYLKLLQKGVSLPRNDLNILCLFAFNSDKDEVIAEAMNKKYVKSVQTGDNTISRLVIKHKLLEKQTDKKRKLVEDLYYFITTEYIAGTVKLHNLNATV